MAILPWQSVGQVSSTNDLPGEEIFWTQHSVNQMSPTLLWSISLANFVCAHQINAVKQAVINHSYLRTRSKKLPRYLCFLCQMLHTESSECSGTAIANLLKVIFTSSKNPMHIIVTSLLLTDRSNNQTLLFNKPKLKIVYRVWQKRCDLCCVNSTPRPQAGLRNLEPSFRHSL